MACDAVLKLMSLHDSILTKFDVTQSEATFYIREAYLYRKSDESQATVHNATIVLKLREVTAFDMDFEPSHSSAIYDAHVTTGSGEISDFSGFLQALPASRLRFEFSSGSTLTCDCGECQIVSLEDEEYMYDWDGPL